MTTIVPSFFFWTTARRRRTVPSVRASSVARLDLAARRGAADVEGAHRELRARLADRLGGDDADRLADVDAVAAREIAPVAERADAAPRLAGEHRADDDLLDAGLLDLLDRCLVELGVGA